MININGAYFDKIRSARIYEDTHVIYRDGWCNIRYISHFEVYYDMEINGLKIGLKLKTKEKAIEYLENIMKGV